jgi:hypothetical protein
MAIKIQYLPLQDLPKCTQIVIFGLKINHLATLMYKNLVSGSGDIFGSSTIPLERVGVGVYQMSSFFLSKK